MRERADPMFLIILNVQSGSTIAANFLPSPLLYLSFSRGFSNNDDVSDPSLSSDELAQFCDLLKI